MIDEQSSMDVPDNRGPAGGAQDTGNVPGVLAAPPATAAALPVRKRTSPLTLILGGTLVALMAFGGGFWAGRGTAPETGLSGPGGASGGFDPDNLPEGFPSQGAGRGDGSAPDGGSSPGEGSFPGGGGQGSPLSGEITTAGEGKLTLKLEDGSEVTVNLTDETVLTDTREIGAADLAVGDQITVMGSDGSDEIDALRVQRGDVTSTWGPGGFGGTPENQNGTDRS
jgi:hypothetical protein